MGILFGMYMRGDLTKIYKMLREHDRVLVEMSPQAGESQTWGHNYKSLNVGTGKLLEDRQNSKILYPMAVWMFNHWVHLKKEVDSFLKMKIRELKAMGEMTQNRTGRSAPAFFCS